MSEKGRPLVVVVVVVVAGWKGYWQDSNHVKTSKLEPSVYGTVQSALCSHGTNHSTIAGEKRHLFFSFPYVCPEPVLAKSSFLYINGSKMPFFAGAGQDCMTSPHEGESKHGPSFCDDAIYI